MIFHDVDQNTDEWLDLRVGKITGSAIGKIMAVPRKKTDCPTCDPKESELSKKFGEPAKKYAIQIALERITEEAQGDSYSNGHMERGHEQEPLARKAYEDEFFCDVSNGGFFDCGSEGCSPDGLVYDDGLIEIKSVIYSIHYKTVERNNIDPSYKWQLYFNLQKTEREWIDFVSYCHAYPKGNKLFVHRLHAVDLVEVFAKMDVRLKEFELLVSEVSKNINGR